MVFSAHTHLLFLPYKISIKILGSVSEVIKLLYMLNSFQHDILTFISIINASESLKARTV